MTLFRGRPVPLVEPPTDLEPDEEVFQVPCTKEIFRDYSDYLERILLYNKRDWACKASRKTGLTYEEALESEKEAAEKRRTIPEKFVGPILHEIPYSMLPLRDLARLIFEKLQKPSVDDIVQGRREGHLYRCLIREILEEDDEMNYRIIFLRDDGRFIGRGWLKEEELIPKKLPFTQRFLKSFIQESTWRKDPWVLHAELAEKHGISTIPPTGLRSKVENGVAVSSTRSGISIFCPTLTLDQPPHHQLNPPPPPQLAPPWHAEKDSFQDSDPAQSDTPTTGGSCNSKKPQSQSLATPAAPAPASAIAVHVPRAAISTTMANNTSRVLYRECQKNHAVNIGGHILDGCGEFMPSAEGETLEALKCAACGCHRNFHRKEETHPHYNPISSNANSHQPVLQSQTLPAVPAQHQSYSHRFTPTPPNGPMMVSGRNGGGGSAQTESSSEDINMYQSSDDDHAMVQPSSRKRFRTKFSQEQKDKMHQFAEKIGWRIQENDEQLVDEFCNEVGVNRQVLKVWMYNNKPATKKRRM